MQKKILERIQNKRYFTSNNYGFCSVFHPNSTAKRVPKFQETVKFQPKCTEFRLRLGLRPRPLCGGFISPHTVPPLSGKGKGREEEVKGREGKG